MKRKVNQKQLNGDASNILCEIINPLIYEDRIDPRVLFNCLDSRFKEVFDPSYLLVTAHIDGAVEELIDEIRKELRSDGKI